jgi:hypothetical protein
MPPPCFLLPTEGLQALSSITDGDPEELQFICHLLCELGLAEKDGGSHLVVSARAMEAFQMSSADIRQQRIAQAYLSLVDWSELDMLVRGNTDLVLCRNAQDAPPDRQLRSQLLLVRHMLLRFLAAAGEDTWCSFADLDAALRSLWPDFFPVPQSRDGHWLSEGPRPAWRLARQAENGHMTAEKEDWEAAQGAFLRLVVQGPLRWLGFANLSELDGRALAVRLHGLGDLLWNRNVPDMCAVQSSEAVLIDSADWTIKVQPRLAPPEIHPFLASIARLEKVSARGYLYRLDMRTAHSAFARRSFPDLMAEWQRIVPVPIPASMYKALEDWWARYGQVHLYEGLALLEVTDDVTLRELESSTSLKQHILARLSPRLLVMRDRAVTGLLAELAAKGYMPREVK